MEERIALHLASWVLVERLKAKMPADAVYHLQPSAVGVCKRGAGIEPILHGSGAMDAALTVCIEACHPDSLGDKLKSVPAGLPAIADRR